MASTAAPAPSNWLSHHAAADGVERIEAFFHGNAYGMHRHDTYAIGITLAGVQAFHYRGGHRQSLPGHTMVLHPDEAHDGQAGTEAGFHYRMLYVDPALVQQVLGGQALPFVVGGISESHRLRAAASAMLQTPDWQPGSIEASDAMLELVLALHEAAGQPNSQRVADYTSCQLAHDYLRDAWQSSVTIEELSAVTGRDRWSLSRDFRLLYGTSPARFHILRKLDAARQQMLAGASLVDVAASTGFADQAHMTRHFTQTYGIPPGRWLRTVHPAAATLSPTKR